MKKSFPFILAFILIACSKKDDNINNPSRPDNNPSTSTAFVGDTISIRGRNLGTDIRAAMVKFGSITGTVLSVSDTSATVIVPDDMKESAVKIHLFSGSNETVSDFKLKAPVIQSISPNTGFAGQQIIISGKGFSNSNSLKQISFGDKQLYAIEAANNRLTIKVPDSIPTGKYTISVTVAGLKTTAVELFSVIPFSAPTFTRFSPETAFIGDTVTLEGEHLGNNAIVHFGDIEATVLSASATAIKVLVPDEIATATVKLELGFGETKLTSTSDFRLKAPVIDSIDVKSGFSGQFLHVYGKGFRKSYKTDQLIFGDKFITANTTRPENAELFMTVPRNLAAGKYAVKVTVAGMTAIANASFEVIVPTISSFTPHSGSMHTEMIITGTNLKNIHAGVGTSVSFDDFETGLGSRIAYIKTTTDTEIKLSVPDGLTAGRKYRVVVSVVSGLAATTEPFTITE